MIVLDKFRSPMLHRYSKVCSRNSSSTHVCTNLAQCSVFGLLMIGAIACPSTWPCLWMHSRHQRLPHNLTRRSSRLAFEFARHPPMSQLQRSSSLPMRLHLVLLRHRCASSAKSAASMLHALLLRWSSITLHGVHFLTFSWSLGCDVIPGLGPALRLNALLRYGFGLHYAAALISRIANQQ